MVKKIVFDIKKGVTDLSHILAVVQENGIAEKYYTRFEKKVLEGKEIGLNECRVEMGMDAKGRPNKKDALLITKNGTRYLLAHYNRAVDIFKALGYTVGEIRLFELKEEWPLLLVAENRVLEEATAIVIAPRRED